MSTHIEDGRSAPTGKALRYKGLLIGVMALIALLLLTVPDWTASGAGLVQTTFINVGQGDSALIRNPGGFDVLLDGGEASAGPTVLAYLRNQGVADIDVMVVSHPDSDHVGGLIDVLEASDIPVLQVVYSGYPGDTATWDAFVTAVANEGLTLTTAQFPQVYTWGETQAHILNPQSGLGNPETNAASIVILLDHNQNQILFTGDIDSSVEATVVARGTPVAAEVLKVAHHGSRYSSSAAFLAAVQPAEAVISVGQNPYGHPAAETLARLRAAGARVWRTDLYGTIIVTSDGLTYSIRPEITPTFSANLPIVIKSPPSPTPTPQPTSTYTPTPLPQPTSTQTPTPLPQPTSTQTPTPMPTAPTLTPSPTPYAVTGNVVITYIFYDGAGSQEPDEYVEIRNDDALPIQLQSWTLRDIAEHVYTFPPFFIQPGQVCRIYTNENHPEWCSFNYGHGSAIWNNTGDCAYLRNASGQPIDDYCY